MLVQIDKSNLKCQQKKMAKVSYGLSASLQSKRCKKVIYYTGNLYRIPGNVKLKKNYSQLGSHHHRNQKRVDFKGNYENCSVREENFFLYSALVLHKNHAGLDGLLTLDGLKKLICGSTFCREFVTSVKSGCFLDSLMF